MFSLYGLRIAGLADIEWEIVPSFEGCNAEGSLAGQSLDHGKIGPGLT